MKDAQLSWGQFKVKEGWPTVMGAVHGEGRMANCHGGSSW